MVSLVHLNTTTSIGYYGPDNTRYGGAEWSVPQVNPGRVTLCVSGRAGDGTYQTACMFVTADNTLPIPGGCWIAVAQKTVTDGCYIPGQLAASASLSATSTYDPGSSYTPPPGYSRSQSIGKLCGKLSGISYLTCIRDSRRCTYLNARFMCIYCCFHRYPGHALTGIELCESLYPVFRMYILS